MSTHIHRLISEGEHQKLDFKFEITDARRIAHSLVAFANTDGGRLLIGVKDNGAIAGVRSEEEYFMLEAAATMYTKPPVPFQTVEWHINGKTVLEVIVPKSEEKPHYAMHRDGTWMVYIRVGDQNLLANKVLLKFWEKEGKPAGVFIKFTEKEKILLEYLHEHSGITLSKFCRIAGIKRGKAEIILVKFLLLKTIEMEITEKQTLYHLRNEK